MLLRHPSQALRATVSQEFRKILSFERGAGPATHRHVQVLVPSSPEVVFIVTPDPRFPTTRDIARAAGPNRTYKGTVFPAGSQITLCLRPDQEIWSAATYGYAVVGLLVEYRA
jgi:hypothetical protein